MRKILIITYYWPPAGGPGVQRWLKFVKYLRDFNIEPIVYIPENPHYPLEDQSFTADIPKGITIYKKAFFEPYKIASLFSKNKTKRISSGVIHGENQSFLEKTMLWIRGNLFIPDARKYWINTSIRYLTDIITKEGIDTIITTGPPHSVHLIGHGLKEKMKVRWLADFRDPWTSIGYHKKLKLTKASQKKHKYLEHLVLSNSDKIIVTSATTKQEFSEITNTPIVVITNGFDTRTIKNIVLDEAFTISHIGSLLTGRNPENLWKALSELTQENEAFKKSLTLQFIGVLSDDVLETIRSYGLESNLNIIGYVSHEKAIVYQQKSQVLLLAEIDSEETKGIIPGKLFEYMAAKRPILSIGPKEWEVSGIVKATNSGKAFTYTDFSNLKSVLLEWFTAYQQQNLEVNSVNIDTYSRKELTKKLAENI
ncbi:MAG: glycosyltransferase family 4 protein [Cellulophaga sp.]